MDDESDDFFEDDFFDEEDGEELESNDEESEGSQELEIEIEGDEPEEPSENDE